MVHRTEGHSCPLTLPLQPRLLAAAPSGTSSFPFQSLLYALGCPPQSPSSYSVTFPCVPLRRPPPHSCAGGSPGGGPGGGPAGGPAGGGGAVTWFSLHGMHLMHLMHDMHNMHGMHAMHAMHVMHDMHQMHFLAVVDVWPISPGSAVLAVLAVLSLGTSRSIMEHHGAPYSSFWASL